MIGSPEINKVLRRTLSPILKQHGFTQVKTRHNWGWHGPCTWVLHIRAVGAYFSDVTGWPPMSVGVGLGVFYDFVPSDYVGPVKLDSNGKPLAREEQCHQRLQLSRGLDQWQLTQRLGNPAEQTRTDLWWIERDGSNVEAVVQDIAQQFLAEGLPWFERMSDLHVAYAEIQQERDCFDKLYRAVAFAKFLGFQSEYLTDRERLKREAERIGRTDILAHFS
jgi:hypothetical protein